MHVLRDSITLFRFLVFSVMSMLIALPAAAEQLVIATMNQDFKPYEFEEQGEVRGVHIDTIRAVAKRLGYDEVVFVRMPWKRLVRSMEQGSVDGISYMGGFNRENNDLSWFHGGNALSVTAARLLVKKDSKLRFNGDESSLEGLTIGVLRGYQYGQNLLERANFNVFAADSIEQLKMMVVRGRIDAAIVSQSEWFDYRQNGSDEYKVLSRPVATIWVYIGFSKAKYGELFSYNFSQELKEFQNTAEYQAIIDRYVTK